VRSIFKRLADWEHWPFYLFYAPISYAWPWYYLKTRSFWFFTASNPTLAFGGFEGERKSRMYEQLPPQFCPASIYIQPAIPFPEVKKRLLDSAIRYPFIVKPDIGMKGILFRKIENEAQLRKYHEHMPVDYIIQEFLDTTLEVSVFYIRMPGQEKGRITALIQKDLFEVKGDGSSTILQLIQQGPAGVSLEKIKKQYGSKLETVLAEGQRFVLSHIGNLVNGAQFTNLAHKVDKNMEDLFDHISLSNQFYYGRYDIKCNSVDDLSKGKDFFILEFNGAGSVPNHIYTGTFSLAGAYKEILYHWRMMYEISRTNRANGLAYWSFQKGRLFLKNSKRHFDVLKKLDEELVLA
jgi:hypothetical protein